MSRGTEPVDDPTGRGGGARDRRSRPVEWVLLEGDRLVVAAGLLAGLLVLLGVLLLTDVVAVTDDDALTRGFAALVGGNMTLITIVISINQLVLSQEFGTPAELQERIEEMIEYRREAEETADVPVSPVTPNAFLELLTRSVRNEAVALSEAVADRPADDDLRADVEDFAETLVDQVDGTMEFPDEPPTKAFTALLTVLDVDFTGNLQQARWLRAVYATDLPDEVDDSLEDLCQLFRLVGVLRQYLETLHLQGELALLSRRLFYVGIPAVVLSIATIWVYGHPAGAVLDGTVLRSVVAVSTVVGLAPLAVFFAYVVRIATVTRRTAGLIPFNVRN